MLLARSWRVSLCIGAGLSYSIKIHVEQSSYSLLNRLGKASLWQRLGDLPLASDCRLPMAVARNEAAGVAPETLSGPGEKPGSGRRFEWLSHALFRSFLPQGYPHTVHRFYTPFCSWWFLQNIVGSVLGALSTQALLVAMGLSSPTALSSAVALQWIMKDALGQFGGIVAAGILGGRFDIETKRLRFLAIVVMYFASLLEIVSLSMPRYFLVLASFANLAKNISWIITSATRASLLSQFAKVGQLGDLTAKSASQGTAAGLIGTGIGIGLSNYFGLGSFLSFLAAYVPLACLGLFSLYKSATYILANSLTRERLDMVLEHYMLMRGTGAAFSVLLPEQVSLSESFVPFTLRRGPKRPLVLINASLADPGRYQKFCQAVAAATSAERYALYLSPDSEPLLWIFDTATNEDCLRAYFKVWQHDSMACHGGDRCASFEFWKEEMLMKGWNLNSLYFPEMQRRQVRLLTRTSFE